MAPLLLLLLFVCEWRTCVWVSIKTFQARQTISPIVVATQTLLSLEAIKYRQAEALPIGGRNSMRRCSTLLVVCVLRGLLPSPSSVVESSSLRISHISLFPFSHSITVSSPSLYRTLRSSGIHLTKPKTS